MITDPIPAPSLPQPLWHDGAVGKHYGVTEDLSGKSRPFHTSHKRTSGPPGSPCFNFQIARHSRTLANPANEIHLQFSVAPARSLVGTDFLSLVHRRVRSPAFAISGAQNGALDPLVYPYSCWDDVDDGSQLSWLAYRPCCLAGFVRCKRSFWSTVVQTSHRSGRIS